MMIAVVACIDGSDGTEPGTGGENGQDGAGTGDDSPTGPQKDPVSNHEADEIEQILNTILENSINRLGAQNSSLSTPDSGIKANSLGLDEPGKNTIADIVANHYDPDSEEYYDYDDETVGSFFEHVTTIAFGLPVVMGDSLRSYMHITDFYGLKIGNAEEGIYGRTTKNGSNIVIEVCGVYSGGVSTLYYMDITYNSEDDFSFSIYEFTEDKSYKMFYYGNSDMEFYVVSYGDVADAEGGGIMFKNAAGAGYIADIAAANEAGAVIEPGFEAISVSDLKAIGISPDHVVPLDIWKACYSEHIYGGQIFHEQEGQFDIRDGVLFGWTGKEEDCPETLMLPSGVAKIYYDFRLPVKVKKLIIPSDIETVVMERGYLEYLTTGQGDGGYSDYEYYEDLVECPAKYFSMIQSDMDGNSHYLDEINASVSSPLFRVENGILYGNDDSMLYIPKKAYDLVSSISVEGAIGASVGQMLYDAAGAMPKLKNIDIKVQYSAAYDGDGEIYYESNLDFLSMLINGEEGSVENRIYNLNRISVSGLREDERGILSFGLPAGYIYGEPYPEIDKETGEPVTDPDTGEPVYIRDVIGVYGIKSVRELRLSGSAERIEISGAPEITVNKLILSGFENWKTLDIGDGIDEANIPYSDSPEYVSLWNTDEMLVRLPWSAYGVFEKELTSMLTDCFEFEQLGIEFDAEEYYSESRMLRFVFAALTPAEKEEADKLKLFDYSIYEGEYNGESMKLADLYGYNGSSKVVEVPSVFMGYTVNSYTFRTPSHPVTEIHVPASVRFFEFDSDVKVGKIAFGSTRSEFETWNGHAEYLLQYAAKIVFKDTELDNLSGNMTYMYSAEGLGSVTVNVSADKGAFEVKFTAPDGKEYIKHTFDYLQSVNIDVSDADWSEGKEAYIVVSVMPENFGDVMLFDISVFYTFSTDTKPTEIAFELVSSAEFTGEISHEMHWFPYAPDDVPECFEGTLVEKCAYCDYKGAVYEYGENDFHNFEVIANIDADCIHPARVKKKCTVCGLERIFFVPDSSPAGHDFSTSEEKIVEADCLEAKHKEKVCGKCGHVEKYDYEGDRLGHSLKEVILHEAKDCTETGEKGLRCERCGFVEYSYEYRPDHKFAEDDICDVCLNHRYFRIEWHTEMNQASVIRYAGEDVEYPETLVIPSELRGVPVGIIDFNGDPKLKKVKISEGITSLTLGSFAGSSVTEVVLPETLREIGKEVFYSCYELKSVTLPENLATIGSNAFAEVNSDFSIIYNGSKRSWSFIVQDDPYSEWAPQSAFVIHCSDGGNIKVENYTEVK